MRPCRSIQRHFSDLWTSCYGDQAVQKHTRETFSPVLALGSHAEFLDVALCDLKCLGCLRVEHKLGLDKLVEVLDRLWVLEDRLHEADCDLRLLHEIVLTVLDLETGLFLLGWAGTLEGLLSSIEIETRVLDTLAGLHGDGERGVECRLPWLEEGGANGFVLLETRLADLAKI